MVCNNQHGPLDSAVRAQVLYINHFNLNLNVNEYPVFNLKTYGWFINDIELMRGITEE